MRYSACGQASPAAARCKIFRQFGDSAKPLALPRPPPPRLVSPGLVLSRAHYPRLRLPFAGPARSGSAFYLFWINASGPPAAAARVSLDFYRCCFFVAASLPHRGGYLGHVFFLSLSRFARGPFSARSPAACFSRQVPITSRSGNFIALVALLKALILIIFLQRARAGVYGRAGGCYSAGKTGAKLEINHGCRARVRVLPRAHDVGDLRCGLFVFHYVPD